MDRVKILRISLLVLLLMTVLSIGSSARAGTSTSYALNWQVFSGGGAPAVSDSGNLYLNGSLGQTSIGPSTGDQEILNAGFWYGLVIKIFLIFLPIVVRNY